jgi:hypothetical protein
LESFADLLSRDRGCQPTIVIFIYQLGDHRERIELQSSRGLQLFSKQIFIEGVGCKFDLLKFFVGLSLKLDLSD